MVAVPCSRVSAATLVLLLATFGCRGGGTDAGAGGAGAGTGMGGAGGVTQSASPLSVMTWNIEQFPLQGSTVQRVRDIIQEQQPDVLAVQEIEDPLAFADLVQFMPDYEGILNDDEGGFLRVGLIYKKDRVQISEVATLYVGNWYAFPRPPLKARVTADGGAYDFVTVVLHLKAQLDQESEDRRRAACELLDTWINNQIGAGVDTEFMLLGDFNDEITDPLANNVFTSFLDKPEQYTFLTRQLAIDNVYTYVPFKSTIDHVLVTNDTLDEYGSGFTNVLPLDMSVANYDTVSDHLPVYVKLDKSP